MNPLELAITIGLTILCLMVGYILIVLATNLWGPLGLIVLAAEVYFGIRYLKKKKHKRDK